LPEDQQRGRMGELAGTLAYLSPEQLRGEVPHLDGRSDIWALGVILYELLTGRKPFGGTYEELREEILEKPPRPLRQIDDTIPSELERICLKCLAKDQSERYSSAKDLADELRFRSHDNRAAALHSFATPALCSAGVALVFISVVVVAVLRHIDQYGAQGVAPQRAEVQSTKELESKRAPSDVTTDPHAWRPLLPPQAALLSPVFPLTRPTDRWEVPPATDFVRSDITEVSLLELGETQSPRFLLRLRLSKSGAGGMAGVYLGFKAISSGEYACQVIALRCVRNDELYMDRTIATVGPLPGNDFTWNPRTTSIRLPSGAIEETELEIRVANFKINEIRWASAPLTRLTAEFSDSRTPDSRGNYGLINAQGASTFHRPEIRDSWNE